MILASLFFLMAVGLAIIARQHIDKEGWNYNKSIHTKGKKIHRDDGPAVFGTNFTAWYKYGKFHRVDGPAVYWMDGTIEWFWNGLNHRDGGPARFSLRDNCMTWYRHGKKHREDGPAMIFLPDRNGEGFYRWYLNGAHVELEEGKAYCFEEVPC